MEQKERTYLTRKRSTVKRQKIEIDDEKEDLKVYLDIVPREELRSSHSTKRCRGKCTDYQIKVSVLQEPERVYLDAYRELYTLFEPDEEDEYGRNQHEFNCDKLSSMGGSIDLIVPAAVVFA
ncbi:hypothetical protein Tco_0352685 [Tanacetum coccineum]